jgi:hypothetical protein
MLTRSQILEPVEFVHVETFTRKLAPRVAYRNTLAKPKWRLIANAPTDTSTMPEHDRWAPLTVFAAMLACWWLIFTAVAVTAWLRGYA